MKYTIPVTMPEQWIVENRIIHVWKAEKKQKSKIKPKKGVFFPTRRTIQHVHFRFAQLP